MSHDHDHPDHDHQHDHDHGHGHDHDHGHSHPPDQTPKIKSLDIDLTEKLKQAAVSRTTAPVRAKVIEDAGTQALSDALKSSFWFLKGIFVLLVLGLVFSCFRQIHPHEVGVVLRFGKPVGTGTEQIRQPGMVFVLPYPIDELVRIPVAGTHTIRSVTGWYGRSAEMELRDGEDVPQEGETLRPGADGYVITSDGNIIHVRATVNYTIENPARYTFDYANATNLLQNVLNNAVLYTSARFTSADALYENKIAFTEAIRNRIEQKAVIEANLGIKVSLVTVDTKVPVAVKNAFSGVQTAVENRNKQVNEARAYSEETVNKARGESQAIINRGMSRSNQVVQAVAAESRSFLAQLPYYQKAPALFEDRLLAQTMERVLTNASDKWFIPTDANGQPLELRMQLNREPEAPKRKRYE